MATLFSTLHPFTIALLVILTFISPLSATDSAQLVDDTCKKTKNYTFCKESLYSDPPITDLVNLAYRAFDMALGNASDTLTYTTILLRGARRDNETESVTHLEICESYYEKAVDQLTEALGDMDRDLYYRLCYSAKAAVDAAQQCDSTFQPSYDHLLTDMNYRMSGLSQICLVVSQQFETWPKCDL